MEWECSKFNLWLIESSFFTRLHKSSSVTILQHTSRSFVAAVYLQTEQIALYFLQLANWPFFIVCKRPSQRCCKNLFVPSEVLTLKLVLCAGKLNSGICAAKAFFPLRAFTWFSPLYFSCCAGAKPRNFALHARSRKLGATTAEAVKITLFPQQKECCVRWRPFLRQLDGRN